MKDNETIFSMVEYDDGRMYFSIFAPLSKDFSGECFRLEYEHHYWKTKNMQYPDDKDKCGCGDYLFSIEGSFINGIKAGYKVSRVEKEKVNKND